MRDLFYFLAGITFLLALPNIANSLLNPAAVYCTSLGYNYSIVYTQKGEVGYCVLPNGKKVPAWKFLRGEAGEEYSYCKIHGYELVTGKEEALCILPNGTKKKVLELMNVSLKEGMCGDGVCVLGETYANCPQDCPSGSEDLYCDGIKDGICDIDCLIQNLSYKDPDCSHCGNGKCEINLSESYLTCPQDCPSGGKDNYCDLEDDGICDPDCPPDLDLDCKNKDIIAKKNESVITNTPKQLEKNKETNKETQKERKPYFYLILGVLILISLLIFLRFRKRPNLNQEATSQEYIQ